MTHTGLVLQPSIHDYSREQIEEFIDTVRAKRMTAAIQYHADAAAKIGHESEKIQRRYTAKIEKLAKAINACEAAEAKIEDCLAELDVLKQELGLLTDSVVITHDDPNEEGND